MLLPDCSYYQQDRMWNAHFSGTEWVFRYNIAKASWEKYGDTPPDKAKVRVLVNGHNTDMPTLLKEKDLEGCPTRTLYHADHHSQPDFGLVNHENGFYSLVDKALWWRSVQVIPEKKPQS